VKRLFALLVGGLGIRALLRRRGHAAPAAPVEELRAKLANARSEPGEIPAEEPVPDVESRRADVHDRARKAIDELGGS
jgi:hypothetical protein